MNERLSRLRAALCLTTRAFGEKINLSGGAVTNMEKGTRNITDRTIADICRRFNVSEEWFRTGNGEMFVQTDATLLDELVQEYNLDDLDKKILAGYLALPDQHRQIFKNYLLNLAKCMEGDSQPVPLRAVSRRGGEAVNDLTKEEAAAAHLERERLLKSDSDQPDL